MNWTPTVSGTGFSVSGSNVTAAANSATTTRSGTATYTQTGSGKTQAVSLSQAAGAQWYLNIEVRDVVTGSPGNWDIEIQYRVTGGNIRNFPDQNDFDVILSFSYETLNGTISVHDALIESTNPITWMDLIGQGWQPSYYGSVSSNSDGSPYVTFNGLHSTATPSIVIQ